MPDQPPAGIGAAAVVYGALLDALGTETRPVEDEGEVARLSAELDRALGRPAPPDPLS